MEKLFEINTIITDQIIKEYSQELYKLNKTSHILDLLCSIATLLGSIICLIAGYYDMLFIMLAFFIFFMFLLFKGYILLERKEIKSFISSYRQLPQLNYEFYNDNIIRTSPITIQTVYYNQITKIVETKNLYLLIMSNIGVMTIDKEAFSIGDVNDFKTFIESKCYL